MDRHEVERRDQRLVQKFRSVVELKETYKRRRRIRQAAMLGGVLVVALAALWFRFQMTPRGILETRVQKEPVAETGTEAMGGNPAAVDSTEKNGETPPPELAAHAELPSGGTSGAAGKAEPAQGETESPSVVKALEPSRSQTSEASPISQAPEKPAPAEPPAVRVEALVACSRVENRQYVEPRSEFSLSEGSGPDAWVWMDVRAQKSRLPLTLRHVYYVNGRQYAAVMLDVRYQRTRTWSNVTLSGSEHLGRWRVDVVTSDGDVIASKAFTVVP